MQCLSEELLSPSLVVDEQNQQETKDFFLKLEADEASEDSNDGKDDADLESGNEDTSPNVDEEVRTKSAEREQFYIAANHKIQIFI